MITTLDIGPCPSCGNHIRGWRPEGGATLEIDDVFFCGTCEKVLRWNGSALAVMMLEEFLQYPPEDQADIQKQVTLLHALKSRPVKS
jgi:hypothetical protein